MRLAVLLLLTLSVSAPSASAVEVDFTQKPTVKKVGDQFEIRFTVSQKTDVEVAIVNREGRVVRHLAAGMLGGQLAPPAPLVPGLSQTLAWDGNDDSGKRAAGGPFAVRVRVGLAPRLGKIIANPAQINPSPHYNRLYGLATDQRGQVYVASGSIYSNTPVYAIKVYDRQGKYLRTILPMPASLAPSDMKEFGEATLRDGFLTPANHDPLAPYVQPGGIVAFLSSRFRDDVLWVLNTEGRICRIRAADGRPLAWNSGPQTFKPSGGPMCWAVSPDGKSLCLAGYWNARATQSRGKIPFNDGILYRVDPGGGIVALPPADDAAPPESARPQRGIAFDDYLFEGAVTAYPRMSPRQNRGCVCKEARFDVDEFGRVYVPDVLQFCIHVYDNAGNLLTEIGHYGNCDDVGRSGPPIPFGWPMSCAVNKAGRLYVADVLNQRIVRVDPAYATEATVALP